MKCPIDQVELVMSERQGIEIDYCPVCRGVWLDRGELDKIIERALPPQTAAPQAARPNDPERGRSRDDDDDYKGRDYKDYKPRKKRESFLGELFDF